MKRCSLKLFIVVCLFAVALTAHSETVLFSDDFNRPDSAVVGNGWFDMVGNIGDNLSISNQMLTNTTTTGGTAGIFRPLSFTKPITFSADKAEGNGYGGLSRHHSVKFTIFSDGVFDGYSSGYGLEFYRSDVNYANSSVRLIDNGVTIALIYSSFQYGEHIHIVGTFNLDGSVTGTVSQPGDSFSFSFPPHAIQSSGGNFSIMTGASNHNTNPSEFIFSRVDNFVITVESTIADIDIKPRSEPNCFNNDGHGVIPVAILSSASFDATQVDPTTVTLDGQAVRVVGKKGNLQASIEDSNGDGLADLIVQIEDTDGTYAEGSAIGKVTGNLYDGSLFEGMDTICIVP